MRGTLRWTITVCLLFAAGTALAGGFNIYEAGARATAMGGAFTATADDGSAIFYNPAGLAFLEGSALDLNLMPVVPAAKFTGAYAPDGTFASGETVDQSFPIPGLYYYTTFEENLTFGLGVYAPFGLGVEWSDPEAWAGRALSYDVDLATVYVSPTFAWKVHEDVAVSFGLDIAFSEIELNRFRTQPFGGNMDEINVIDAKISGSCEPNFTPQAGVMIRATDRLTLGAMFHQQKDLAIQDGKMELTNVAPAALEGAVDGIIAGLGGAEHDGTTVLHLPHMLSLAAAYQLTDAARVEVDFVHFNWSTFDKLVLDFNNPMLDQSIEEQYEDVWQFRAGLSYDLSPELTAMAGYVRDNTPQPVESMSPLLPDSDRNDASVGLAYRVSDRLTFTGSYMAVIFKARSNVENGEIQSFDPEISPAGTYDSRADIFGIGIGYKF
ncbi:outer membrane protein transport protein [bacterium]|nr:outer membrane protein transport protein [bacterium]HPF36015.1 outer membrane protein transport protein [Candidatus Krumholzibacteria bacterium]HRX51580.1 outer membrane protein transport protein [Candidatus Krumholzibacteria bacterium]